MTTEAFKQEASRTPNTEMVVKALEWEATGNSDWVADSVVGQYVLNRDELSAGGCFNLWMPDADDDDFGIFTSAAEAKAAAQADFDQRIRSALASPPSPAEVPDARPLDDWHEDMGDVLWWCYRDGAWLGEAPYVGSPLDLGQTVEIEMRSHQGEFVHQHNVGGWPGYHTHWTPLPARPSLQLNKKG